MLPPILLAISNPSRKARIRRWGAASLFGLLVSSASAVVTDAQWQELQEQNRLLREQQKLQQSQIEELRSRLDQSAATVPGGAPASGPADAAQRKLVISGEVGLAYFGGGSDSAYPNDEFRVDDATIRLEAPLWRDTYFFGELITSKREGLNDNFYLGEFYVEFENVSGALGGPERLLNVRFGRVNIPFGEEYQHRGVLANPLVTHSLSDVWGTDEGIEIYGEAGAASYAFAVQNGGSPFMHDAESSKALTLRLGYDVTSRLHLSASAMRTGKLLSSREPLSEVWLGNNVFRNIGSGSSSVHQGEIGEIDASYKWTDGHVIAAAGVARYVDNDHASDNTRHFTYFQIEGMQAINRQLYAAARFSSLHVDKGYPLAGIGNFNKYFLGSLLTRDLERLSLGAGYHFTPSLGLKFEYTIEDGELTTGASRDNRMFSAEAAVGF